MSTEPIPAPRISPQEFVFDAVPGLDLTTLRQAVAPGLHVVIGPNNAGKTRLLRAVRSARFAAQVSLREFPRKIRFENQQLLSEWAHLPPIRLVWPRELPPPPETYELSAAPQDLVDVASIQDIQAGGKPGLERRFWIHLSTELWPYIANRNAVLVPTNRYLIQEARLTDNPLLEQPTMWPALLSSLAHNEDPTKRGQFDQISGVLDDITEGVSLRSYGRQDRAVVYIAEKGAPERQLDDCGDGLRDLIGILLFTSLHRGWDLLFDEPGLRLHPHTQRRLLRYLDAQGQRPRHLDRHP